MQETNRVAKWLSEREVAAITGISVSTLQKQRHYRRGISYTKIGRTVRYDEADVAAYMDAHRIDIATEGPAKKISRKQLNTQ